MMLKRQDVALVSFNKDGYTTDGVWSQTNSRHGTDYVAWNYPWLLGLVHSMDIVTSC